jgi:hypothetical protein
MFDTCLITKRKFDQSVKFFNDPKFRGFIYYFKPVGNVKITEPAVIVLENNKINLNPIAGICRCAYELKEEPPLINADLLNSIDEIKNIPRSTKEKYDHFLTMLFKTGGSDLKPRKISVYDDYPLAYANDISEFQNIIDFAIDSKELECIDRVVTEEDGPIFYVDLKFTPKGLKKINKLLNNYFSLIQPIIDSGNIETDRKINHAVSMFYQDNSTVEDKRSACEELSFLLEPFRKDLDKYFLDKDVNLFFQLVNEFDIRHNKEKTKKLIYEEQIEWIFQCLLNTLITFIKLRKRFM